MSKNLDKIIDGLDEELINHAAETMAKSKKNTLKNAHAKRVIRTSAAAAACLCTVIVGIIVSGRLGLSVSGSTVTASAEQIPDEVSDTSAENTSEATECATTQIMVGAYTTEEILLIYINQSDTIEELNQAIYKAYSDMVTSVCVYKNESDYKNKIEVPEGALENGMIIHIEYNYGEGEENSRLLLGIKNDKYSVISTESTAEPTISEEEIPDESSYTLTERTTEATEYTTTQIMVGAYTTEEILLIYINQSDTIEELNQAIYKAYSDMVTSVCVYKNESDYKNRIEVPEGALENGMIIHIEFNYGEDVTAEPKEFTTVKIGEQQEIHLPCIRCINY